jgi:hypothetical protein
VYVLGHHRHGNNVIKRDATFDVFKLRFERTYGTGSWIKFCHEVWQDVRPKTVVSHFTNQATGVQMGKQPYYKWKARADLFRPKIEV